MTLPEFQQCYPHAEIYPSRLGNMFLRVGTSRFLVRTDSVGSIFLSIDHTRLTDDWLNLARILADFGEDLPIYITNEQYNEPKFQLI